MRLLIFLAAAMIVLSPAGLLGQNSGDVIAPPSFGPSSIGPSYFGPSYSGFGVYGNGIYGPGYYGPGAGGIRLYQPTPQMIDPSSTFGGYGPQPLYRGPVGLAPVLGGPGNVFPYSAYPYSSSPYSSSPGFRRGSSTAVWPSRGEIKIVLDKSAKGEIVYSLNELVYSIKPGYEQKFADDRNWVVAFRGGNPAKVVRYTLTAGTYRFYATEKGWELGRVGGG